MTEKFEYGLGEVQRFIKQHKAKRAANMAQQVSISLPGAMVRKLDAVKRETGYARSQVIQAALEDFFESYK